MDYRILSLLFLKYFRWFLSCDYRIKLFLELLDVSKKCEQRTTESLTELFWELCSVIWVEELPNWNCFGTFRSRHLRTLGPWQGGRVQSSLWQRAGVLNPNGGSLRIHRRHVSQSQSEDQFVTDFLPGEIYGISNEYPKDWFNSSLERLPTPPWYLAQKNSNVVSVMRDKKSSKPERVCGYAWYPRHSAIMGVSSCRKTLATHTSTTACVRVRARVRIPLPRPPWSRVLLCVGKPKLKCC